MKRKILINARYPEERRVAIVEGDVLIDFYVEVSAREHLKGNIYKGAVARIEPGLQAAFVDFGSKRHGFLQFREITPSNFQKKEEGEKHHRIQDVISKGQEIIVQVEKDERDTKGASLTTYLSLPGRYIVMMPGQERVGVSRKIEDREDRERLKEMFNALKLPKGMGFILRTAGSDRTGEDLANDLKYLVKLWNRIQSDAKKAHVPALIYKEQDIAVRTVRDYLTSDVGEVLVDDEDSYKRIKDFLRRTAPWHRINITLYKEKRPIFSRHNIEVQIAKIHERHVYLPSRGYLVFDRTEALTAIDVNSGRSRKEENVEATALRTNIEAADEIARQLRLRDIGGLIVIDFIDMSPSKNRKEVETRLRSALSTDKAHWETTPISRFGIVEMTRERLRPAYLESINRKCPTCGGMGIIRTDEVAAVSALREIHLKCSAGDVRAVTCTLPVESANYLINTKRDELAIMEKECGLKITVLSDRNLLPGQFTVEAEQEAAEEKPEEKTEKAATHEHPQAEKAEKTEQAARSGRPRRRGRRGRGRRKKTEGTARPEGTEQPTAAGEPGTA